jgi:hypothetical protein
MPKYPDSIHPITPVPTGDAFERVQSELERSGWQGRGPDYTLPGGGNNPGGSHSSKTVGPDGLLDKGNA